MGANAFKLTLPATMRVYLVFNISLLWPYQGEYRLPETIEVKGEAEYKVEKIIWQWYKIAIPCTMAWL